MRDVFFPPVLWYRIHGHPFGIWDHIGLRPAGTRERFSSREGIELEAGVKRLLVSSLILAVLSTPAYGRMTFKKVEMRTTFGAAEQGNKGKLVIDGKQIRFTKNNGAEYFAIPAGTVSELFYSRVSGRRIGAAVFVTVFLLFSKGRKHYLTITFNDGADLVGAVEFKLHKSNYRGALRTAEQVTGLTMLYDQEGIKDTKQTVARRGDNAPRDDQGSLKISSDPEGAEIEIDGAFVGNTPRIRTVQPGRHKVRLKRKGYADWERKVAVEAGETLEIDVELESN